MPQVLLELSATTQIFSARNISMTSPLIQGDRGGDYNPIAAGKLEEMGYEVATKLRLYAERNKMRDLYDP
jgi:hypothetical protein